MSPKTPKDTKEKAKETPKKDDVPDEKPEEEKKEGEKEEGAGESGEKEDKSDEGKGEEGEVKGPDSPDSSLDLYDLSAEDKRVLKDAMKKKEKGGQPGGVKKSPTKAKAKPKAKGKGKAKAKPKASAKAEKVEDTDDDEEPPKKKKKVKKTEGKDGKDGKDDEEKKKATKLTLKQQTEDWQKKLAEEEQDAKAEVIDTEESRDRQKAQKYAKMEKAGALPAAVKEAMEAADKSTNPRAAKTALINRLFRKEGGVFVMAPNDPSFQRVQKHLDTRYGKEENTSMPYNMVLWEKFHGNKVALQQAIDDGDLAWSTYKGKEYLSFNTVTQGRQKEMVESTELNDGKHQLNEDEHGQIEGWLKKMALGVEGSMEVSDAAGSGGEKGTQVLMLKDQQAQPKWEAVEQILIQAKQAQEKLIRESMKLKDKVIKAGDGELTKAFKESLAVLQDNDRKLDHIIMWKAGLGTFGFGFFPGFYLKQFFGALIGYLQGLRVGAL